MADDSKTVEIKVPASMDDKTAEQCFLMGMQLYTSINNAGVVVGYGVLADKEIAVRLMAFKGDYAVAAKKFCDGVSKLQESSDDGKNLAIIRDQGGLLLNDLENNNNDHR